MSGSQSFLRRLFPGLHSNGLQRPLLSPRSLSKRKREQSDRNNSDSKRQKIKRDIQNPPEVRIPPMTVGVSDIPRLEMGSPRLKLESDVQDPPGIPIPPDTVEVSGIPSLEMGSPRLKLESDDAYERYDEDAMKPIRKRRKPRTFRPIVPEPLTWGQPGEEPQHRYYEGSFKTHPYYKGSHGVHKRFPNDSELHRNNG